MLYNKCMEKYLTVILGSSVDIFYRLDSYPEEGDFSHGVEAGMSAGGCSLNVGCIASSRGATVKALDYLKKGDEATTVIVKALEGNGVDTSRVIYADDCTDGKVVIANTGDKRTMFVIDPIRPPYVITDEIRDLLYNSTYMYSLLHMVRRSFENTDVLKEARKHGAKMIFDGSSKYDDPSRVKMLLELTDGLFINEHDYATLAAVLKKDPAEELFERGCEFVCVTSGSGLARCFTPEKEYSCPALHLDEIVDSTGAGDSFAASFLYGRLMGYDYEKCLKLAVAGGAYACLYMGGLGGCCSVEELMAFAREHGMNI